MFVVRDPDNPNPREHDLADGNRPAQDARKKKEKIPLRKKMGRLRHRYDSEDSEVSSTYITSFTKPEPFS